MQQKFNVGRAGADPEARRLAVNAANTAYRKANPDKAKAWQERYRLNNPERFRQSQRDYKRKRYGQDAEYRLVMQLRARLSKVVGRSSEVSAAIAQCGCTAKELLRKLESQFLPGMGWEDRSAWHIDHIYPVSAINPKDRRQVLAVNNWRNLRPVWPDENRSKSDSVSAEAAALFEQIVKLTPDPENSYATEV